MANVAHSTLTGAELHEPKGVETASLGEVYVADGAGSGNWANVGTSSFTGMIADFTWPVVQDGWLELDGATISTTTYAALYNVMVIEQSGTRTIGSPIITSLTSTTHMRVGYYVFGAGITSGTTVLSIDSPTQITLSANASSSGSNTVAVSPWLIGSGTITLPNVTGAGRYRRSRTSSTRVGLQQADQNKAHTHSVSVTGSTDSQGSHSHTANVTDPGHVHGGIPQPGGAGGSPGFNTVNGTMNTASATTGITVSIVSGGAHTHSVTGTGTAASDGGTENRPLTLVVMTCVKT